MQIIIKTQNTDLRHINGNYVESVIQTVCEEHMGRPVNRVTEYSMEARIAEFIDLFFNNQKRTRVTVKLTWQGRKAEILIANELAYPLEIDVEL